MTINPATTRAFRWPADPAPAEAPKRSTQPPSALDVWAPIGVAGVAGAVLGVGSGMAARLLPGAVGGVLGGFGGAMIGGVAGAAAGTLGTVAVLDRLSSDGWGSKLSFPYGFGVGGVLGMAGGAYLGACAAGPAAAAVMGVAGAITGLAIGVSASLGHSLGK